MRNCHGCTPLCYLCRWVVGQLLGNCAGGVSALEAACFHADAAIAQLLLEHGAAARVNERCESRDADLNEMTLLHGMAIEGWEQVMEVLLEHGADPNLRDRKGVLPHNLACQGSKLSPIYIRMKSMVGDGSIRFITQWARMRKSVQE